MGVMSGVFIILDGQSGTGKTTVSRMPSEHLRRRGRQTLLTATLSTSHLGRLARNGTFDLRGPELALLVAADRYHHERTVIRPAVADGTTVICDRYLMSAMAFDRAEMVARRSATAVLDAAGHAA